MQDSPTNKVYVLIPFDLIRALHGLQSALAADTTYQTAAADFMNRTKKQRTHTRASILRFSRQ